MKKKTIFVAFALATIFTACEKDENPTVSEMITNKDWILTEMIVDQPIDLGFGEVSDLYSLMDACEKDNIYRFNTDGSFAQDENVNVCDISESPIITGIWQLSEDEKTITVSTEVDGLLETFAFAISEVSNQIMKGAMEVDFYGFTITPNITFERTE